MKSRRDGIRPKKARYHLIREEQQAGARDGSREAYEGTLVRMYEGARG